MTDLSVIDSTGGAALIFALGAFIVMCMIAYLIYIVVRWYKVAFESEAHYYVLENALLRKAAEARGINLDEEIVKYDVMRTEKKNLRKSIRESVYDEWNKKA